MTGYLLDDPAFMVGDKERKEKVDKVFSDVEQLQKESKLSDRYMYIIQLIILHRCMSMKLTLIKIQYSEHSHSAKLYELIASWYLLF